MSDSHTMPSRPWLNAATPAQAAADLHTLRDLLRHAVSRFRLAEERGDLVFGHGTTTAIDEAAFLVLEALSLPIDDLGPWLDCHLTLAERTAICELVNSRVVLRKPLPYLLNRAYIQGIPFYVDERVIVPRSYLGELLFSDLFGGPPPALVEDVEAPIRVLDLCTGSGCLAILAAMVFPNAQVDAVDLSFDALEVARINVANHELGDRVSLIQGDLFEALEQFRAPPRYDLIITNPPYVAADAMAMLPAEARKEPEMALGSGEDGLDHTRDILAQAGRYLTDDGGLLCEVGTAGYDLADQFPEVDFLWLDTENGSHEVFWLSAAQLRHHFPTP